LELRSLGLDVLDARHGIVPSTLEAGWGATLRKSGPTTNQTAGGEELKAA
jgi:hypothetical protein